MSENSHQHFLDRIHQLYPSLDLSNAVVNGDGLVNVAIMCDGRVYRFARDEKAVQDLAQETLVLELVRQYVTMYDERIPSLIDRARFYAGTFELQWVLGGIRSGDNDWFTAHLDRARDVQPYGQPL